MHGSTKAFDVEAWRAMSDTYCVHKENKNGQGFAQLFMD